MKRVNVLYDRGIETNYCETFEIDDNFICNPRTLSKMIYEETGFQISSFQVKVWSVWEEPKKDKLKAVATMTKAMCLN